ncbi:MAG: hypothetical protein AMK71_03000 [Nitrospira bacterium SG8_35_4]|nr:MAG: hypothetical protein AMK71_03000 [Nitrospira bacterium SG8_35_4]
MGLHIALKTLGVEKECDEVIIPDFACRSLYDCVRMAGGTPVFCDINLDDYSLDLDSVRSVLNSNTKSIILPHMYGCPADIDAFLNLGVPVIEDCAHSMGAMYNGKTVGSLGTLSVFSFEGSKIVAAGEGGVVLSSADHVVERLINMRRGRSGKFIYHYRLSDIIAAIALIQIEKLPVMIKKRKEIAQFYMENLSDLEREGHLKLPSVFSDRDGTYYRFVVLCQEETSDLIRNANERGIFVRNPMPSGCLSDSFDGIRAKNLNAKRLAGNGLSLPIYPDLTKEEMQAVVNEITTYITVVNPG